MKLCVLALRGLGAGHAGAYGNRWIDTPSLNALAAQATLFDWHLSAHPAFARHVWRTGRHCFAGPNEAAASPDLIALLREAGVVTQLLLDDSRPSSPVAWEAGWNEVRRATGLSATIAAARERLAELSSRTGDALLWIEFASLLPPWDVKEEFTAPYFDAPAATEEDEEEEEEDEDDPDEEGDETTEEASEEEEEPLEPLFDPPVGPVDAEDDLLFEVIQTTYGAAITQLDAALADLLDGLADDVGLIVTSDGGQALAERGVVGPVPWAHREIVHVPLLLRLPGRTARRRSSALTLSTDLAPTIAELFGRSLPSAHGRSLLPLLASEVADWRDYACVGGWKDGQAEWGLWTRERTLLLQQTAGAEARLYVKPDDRREVNDVSQHRLEETDRLAQTLRAYVEACSRPGPLVVPPVSSVSSDQ